MSPTRAAVISGVTPLVAARFGSGSRVEKQGDQGVARVEAGERERRRAVVVDRIDVGPGAEQQRGHCPEIAMRRPVERGRAVALGRVDVRAAGHEALDAGTILGLDRVDESRLRGGDHRGKRDRSRGEEYDEHRPDPHDWTLLSRVALRVALLDTTATAS